MIFLVLSIIAIIVMIKLDGEEEYGWASLSAAIGLICGCLLLVCTGLNMRNYNDIKAETQNIAMEYRLSSRTIEDWERTVNQYEHMTQHVEKADDNDIVYAWIDILYFFGYRSSPEEHIIIITDDKIEFPVDYNWPPLQKPDDQT